MKCELEDNEPAAKNCLNSNDIACGSSDNKVSENKEITKIPEFAIKTLYGYCSPKIDRRGFETGIEA